MANDNSLLIALAELKDIEAQRLAGERAAEAKEKKDAAEAIAQKAAFAAEERAERQAVAEAKARLSLEAEAKSSMEAEASKARLVALQAQLHSIQAERRVLHERVLLAGTPTAAAPSRSPWPVAFAASTALAMALGAWLFVRGPEVQVREVLVPVVAPVAALELPEPSQNIEVEVPVEEPVAVAEPEPAPRVRTHPRPRPRPRTPVTLAELDCDANDPLCGL
ncbi:MAG: hypothetical protein ACI9KE_003297 [Polyangiales bacterium]|jgi:hypothetical protein